MMDLVDAFLDGMRWARQHSLAADADGEHWITVNGGSKTEGDHADEDLFGAYQKTPPQEIIRRWREQEGIKY